VMIVNVKMRSKKVLIINALHTVDICYNEYM